MGTHPCGGVQVQGQPQHSKMREVLKRDLPRESVSAHQSAPCTQAIIVFSVRSETRPPKFKGFCAARFLLGEIKRGTGAETEQ